MNSMNRIIRIVCLVSLVLMVVGLAGACHSKTATVSVVFSLPAQQPINYPYQFAVFSDSHATGKFNYFGLGGVNKIQALIINKIVEAKPDFVISNGDRLNKGGLLEDWAEFDRLNATFRDHNISYYPILGNHDLLSRNDKDHKLTTVLDNYFKRFPYLDGRRWYDFSRGNTGFIMLDSNISKMKSEEVTQQKQWLVNTLDKYEKDAAVSFVIVCMHHPLFTNSVQHNIDPGLQNVFLPILEKSAKLKLVFCGHHHSYERFKIKGVNYIVSGGGGGHLYDELPPDKIRCHDEYSPDKPRGHNFCWLTVLPDKIQFKSIHLNTKQHTWQEGDSLEITK
jgi:3',5'-cyclic AMP phosphodiesterase CpdA